MCKQAVCTRNEIAPIISAWNVGRLFYYNVSAYLVVALLQAALSMHATEAVSFTSQTASFIIISVLICHSALSICSEASHKSTTTLSKHFGLWLRVIGNLVI